MDTRAFCKYVLRYIMKHGDTGDHEVASRFLAELTDEDNKRQEEPASVQATPAKAPASHGKSSAPATANVVKPESGPPATANIVKPENNEDKGAGA